MNTLRAGWHEPVNSHEGSGRLVVSGDQNTSACAQLSAA